MDNTIKHVPEHKGWPLIGNVVPFLKDLFYYPQELKNSHGPIFRMNIPQYNPIFVFDPAGIHHVLTQNHQNYKKSKDYDSLKLILGKGLLTNEGDSWKSIRKELQPYFFETAMTEFIHIMNHHSQELVKQWSTSPKGIHINSTMKNLTLQIASKVFFGQDLNFFSISIPKVVDQLNAIAIKKMRFPRNQIPYSWPTPIHRQMKRLIKCIDNEINTLQTSERDDAYNLLNLLVSNKHLSPQQVRDEIVTFLLAGYETTANTMMFTTALLANHKDIQQSVIDEVRATPLDSSEYKQWPKQFPLLHACIKESLRLYPPAWMIGRQTIEDDQLLQYHIPKDSNVIIDLFLLHRQNEFFDEPERFNPQRFLDKAPKKNTYLPFGGGPRVCIGQHFSMLEMVSIFHHIFSTFTLESIQTDIELDALVTLTPKRDIIVDVN